jgi:magnesium-transporting ATPase (P-type)
MLSAFHKISLFHILWRKGYWVWLSAAVLILGAAAWSISFPFQRPSSNFQAIFTFCVILGIAMLAIAFYVLRIGNRRHEAAENALRRANEILEKRVTELAEKEVALRSTR